MTSVHVESLGQGPPLVLLHDWAMHSGFFATLALRLAQRFRILLIDLPGHGRSADPAKYTLEAFTAAVVEGCGPLAGADAPLSVLGWSFGGSIALDWARAAPDRVARPILVAATPCFVSRPDWPHAMSATTLKRFADELSVAYRLTMQRFVALQVQGSERARETLAALHPDLLRGELSPATLRAVPALIERTDLRSDLRQIAQETVVIAGERDALVPRAASRWLAETLPRASYRSIAGAAHARFLSHPGAFLGLIADGH